MGWAFGGYPWAWAGFGELYPHLPYKPTSNFLVWALMGREPVHNVTSDSCRRWHCVFHKVEVISMITHLTDDVAQRTYSTRQTPAPILARGELIPGLLGLYESLFQMRTGNVIEA